ncbi:MAG: hypothetical protein ABIJ14_01975 [Nanoarchaeota archaeon]
MKIGFVHYNWKEPHGVYRVVDGNVQGLRHCFKDVSIKIIGEKLNFVPEGVESFEIPLESCNDSYKIADDLETAVKDCDKVIIENPMVGSRLPATLAFKEFSENTSLDIYWRHHDFVDDRPDMHNNFLHVFGSFENAYARTSNVSHLTLISFNKRRLEKKGIKATVIPNPIISSDFYYDEERARDLSSLFEKKGILKQDEKPIVYPSRVLRRKNMEEALLLTKMLNSPDVNHKLIITLAHDKDDYREELEKIIEDYGVPCSLGEAEEYIGFNRENGFVISDLYSMCRLNKGFALTTSVIEGFCYGLIEPWLVGVPVIGRDIPEVSEDFTESGMCLEYMYGNDVFPVNNDSSERTENIRNILDSPLRFEEIKKILDLELNVERAKSHAASNKEVVMDKYDYIKIAKELYRLLNG